MAAEGILYVHFYGFTRVKAQGTSTVFKFEF